MRHVWPTVYHRHQLGSMQNNRGKGNPLDTDICFRRPGLCRWYCFIVTSFQWYVKQKWKAKLICSAGWSKHQHSKDEGDGSEYRCASANYSWTTTTYCHNNPSWKVRFATTGEQICILGKGSANPGPRAFIQLRPVWRSGKYSRARKVKIYQSCLLSVLLYGSECWRMTVADLKKLQTFQRTCGKKSLASSAQKHFHCRPLQAAKVGGYQRHTSETQIVVDWSYPSKRRFWYRQGGPSLDIFKGNVNRFLKLFYS